MTLILLVLLILIMCGGGLGYRSGSLAWGSPMAIILLVVVVVLLFGLVGPQLGFYLD